MRFPKRPPRGQLVTDTPEEVYYNHLAHLPSVIDDKINSLDEEKCTNLIKYVMSKSVIDAHTRAKEKLMLVPFLLQEKLKILEVDTFQNLANHFSKVLEALGTLVSLHNIVCLWSQEVFRVKEKVTNCRDISLEIHEEILRILEVYDEYVVKFQEFRSYPDMIQNSFYSIKFVLESDVQIWVERLMSPGFSIKPGITL